MKILMLILLIALVTVTACNNTQQDNDSADNPDATPPQENTQPTDNSDDNQEPETTRSNSLNEIQEFFTKKQTATYMVEYDMESTNNGETFSSTFAQYVKNAKKFRIDITTNDVESRTYIDGNTFTSCMNQDGWTCFEIENEPTESDNVQNTAEKNIANYNVKNLGPRTIAGTTATCFKVDIEDSAVEWCFSKEGIPLYIKTEGDGFSNEMSATSYSTTVSNSVFDLPAEPQDFSDLLPDGVNIPNI